MWIHFLTVLVSFGEDIQLQVLFTWQVFLIVTNNFFIPDCAATKWFSKVLISIQCVALPYVAKKKLISMLCKNYCIFFLLLDCGPLVGFLHTV